MKLVIGLLVLAGCAFANQRVTGFCAQGSYAVVTNAVNSVTLVERSFPRCTVTVYATGTLTLSTIYSDNSNTPLANPFTAAADGSWFFYAANGRYDATMSGGQGGGIPAPFTVGDILLQDNSAGGTVTSVTGASGVSCNTVSGAVTCTATFNGNFTGLAGQIAASQIPNTTITPAMLNGVQGNGAKTQLSTGTTTTDDCVKFDANGNTVDAGAACGSGGGALPAATNQLTYLRVQPNVANLTSFEWANFNRVDVNDYNFSALSCNGSNQCSAGGSSGAALSAGSPVTLTLQPCPRGVNPAGTDPSHYYYVSGGTGTAEAVLSTGGTCASGPTTTTPANGTLTFTPANSHTGAWTLQSATAGIMEAERANVDYSALWLPSKGNFLNTAVSYQTYATTTIDRGNTLVGTAANASIIACQFNNANCVQISNGAGVQAYVGVRNLTVLSNVAAGTSGSMLKIQDKTIGFVTNLEIGANAFTGLELDNSGVGVPSEVQYSGVQIDSGTNLGVFDKSCGGWHQGFSVTASTTATAAIEITIPSGCLAGGEVWTNTATQGGINSIYLLSSSANQVGELHFYNTIIDGCQNTCIYMSNPSGANSGFTIEFGGGEANSLLNGAQILKGWDKVSIHDMDFNVTNTGIYIQGSQAIKLSNNRINSAAAFPNGITVWDSNGNSTGTATAGIQIIGNTIGYDVNGSTCDVQIGIWFAGTTSPTGLVSGNDICGTTEPVFTDNTTSIPPLLSNRGVDTFSPPTVASATTVTLSGSQVTPNLYISGTTTTTTINGPKWVGRRIKLIKTDVGSVTVGGGGNIPGSHTLAQNGSLELTWDGSNWY